MITRGVRSKYLVAIISIAIISVGVTAAVVSPFGFSAGGAMDDSQTESMATTPAPKTGTPVSGYQEGLELGDNGTTHPLDPGPNTANFTMTVEHDNGTTKNYTFAFNSTKIENKLASLINEHREANGLPRVEMNETLNSSARAKSYDMYDRDYSAHIGPNDERPGEFLERSGATCHSPVGENININVGGPIDPDNESVAQKLFEDWKNSEGHNELMLREGVDTGFGVGIHLVHKNNAIQVRATMHKC